MSWFIRLRDSWITLCQDTPKTRLGNQCEFVGYNCRTQVFQVDYVFLFQRMFFFLFCRVGFQLKLLLFPETLAFILPTVYWWPWPWLRKGGGGCNLHGQVTFQKHEVFTRGARVFNPLDENSVSFFSIGFLYIFFWGNLRVPVSNPGSWYVFFVFFAKALLKSIGRFLGSFYWGLQGVVFFFVQFLALEKLVDFRNGRQKLSPTGSYRIGESFWIFDLPSRELTCPTFGKGLSSSKAPWDEIC